MADKTTFEQLVKDALAKLYDYAALETHPLNQFFPLPSDKQQSRAKYLRGLIIEAITKLHPPNWDEGIVSIEARPYLILQGRYVEGFTLQELRERLSLSGRQLRREQGKALKAVVTILWDELKLRKSLEKSKPGVSKKEDNWNNNFQSFEVTQENLDIVEVMQGVANIFQHRVKNQEITIEVNLPKELPPILADRVILRQMLLRVFSYALYIHSGSIIKVEAENKNNQVILWIKVQTKISDPVVSTKIDEVEDEQGEETSLEFARYWCKQFRAVFTEDYTPTKMGSIAQFSLVFPQANQDVVLVVDDQETAIKMFKRYLSRSNLKVLGVQESDQVLTLASELQPKVITLDVMMPTLDGWEVLQALQTNPETQHIPVIVCSVWNEPELATSLGAVMFLKKPITRQVLLDALTELNLIV